MVAHAGRAWLVIVVAVLAGLVLMQGSPCGDAAVALISGSPHPAMITTAEQSGTAVPGLTDGGESLTVGAALAWELPTGATDDLGGVVGLCLSLLVAVLVAVAGLPQPGPMTRPLVLAGPGRAAAQIRCRAPRLAMLCVLQT